MQLRVKRSLNMTTTRSRGDIAPNSTHSMRKILPLPYIKCFLDNSCSILHLMLVGLLPITNFTNVCDGSGG